MSTGLAPVAVGPSWHRQTGVALLIICCSVLLGVAVGAPSPAVWISIGVLTWAATIYASLKWPFWSLLVMMTQAILLVVVRLLELRSVNFIDLLMPPVLLATLYASTRLRERERLEPGVAHERLRLEARGLTHAVLWFSAAALLSLVQLTRLAGVKAALDSGLLLTRSYQGLLFYPMCAWWLRGGKRVESAWNALIIAGIALAAVNVIGVTFWDVKRAGMTLFLNNTDAPLSTPNEAGITTLFVAVVAMVRQSIRPNWKNVALVVLMLLVLGLTQSRSGILAWATFGLFTLRWVRPVQLLAGTLGVAAMLPIIPEALWIRLTRSIMLEPGSNEAISMFVRLFTWRVAWDVFRDFPWTGVGYIGFRFVSHRYNQFNMLLGTVENYYFEMLVSLGIFGFGLLVWVIVKLFRLGHEVRRIAPKDTLAHQMARFHTPLMLALLVANMTGDNLTGLTSLAQVSLWTAILVRSGHAAVSERAPS